MRKTIRIGNKDYFIKSSAWTQFKYRNDTGRRMLADIQNVSKFNELPEEEQIGKMEDVMEVLLRMAYIMIEEADPKQVTTFEDFLKDTDGLFDNTEWINDVVEYAAAPISRGVQSGPQAE